MDVNGDGKLDLLSGSYSRHDPDMAGLFQVLLGTGDHAFAPPAVLDGTDGKPLIVTADKQHVTDKICTRPFAVDLDGDAKLDIVTGNFSGTFAWFRGEGAGKFAPEHELLKGEDGEPLKVSAHSDPFLVDWDGDGDLDLISGSSDGGVALFPNAGSAKQPRFGRKSELLAPPRQRAGEFRTADQLSGPQTATRVWVDDLNGDGKLDLLLGDNVTLTTPAEGLDEAGAKAKLEEWNGRQKQLMDEQRKGPASPEKTKRYQEDMQKLQKERGAILKEERTGFVWVLYRK